jgi:hypothetical protein
MTAKFMPPKKILDYPFQQIIREGYENAVAMK